ncbi:TetR/AcrR family transcriptional regulator [Catenovulum sp. 2E275]|uniref:TetR/AcrR family transcriptional regulator n=1 Tax=Catenovulum sp. 2E275 TaxID=2980497 RepID=UPI0021D3C203|nr:TetR/AcrR family transcriptional regulator [Catenovulum sp. 2E275]MCU4676886.1 TetR/AcrR family transcriptional regulator [Catenovulum sp. 2E275]
MKLSDKKRLDILSAAQDLFYSQGVEHTSMDQIAKQANASKRTVYNHFSTKEVLFEAILNRMFLQLDSIDKMDYNPALPIKNQLLQIAQQEAQLLSSDSFLRIAKVAFMQMLQQPELAKQLSNNKIGCLTFLESFLEQAVNAKALNINDPEFAAKQLIFQLKSFIFYPRLYGFEIPTAEQEKTIIEETIELFLARYKAK